MSFEYVYCAIILCFSLYFYIAVFILTYIFHTKSLQQDKNWNLIEKAKHKQFFDESLTG